MSIENLYFNLKEHVAKKPLMQVKPIERSGGAIFTSLEQIPLYVELPLVEAVEQLWLKGIRTNWASANRMDVSEERNPLLMIDFTTLTLENMRIAIREGKLLPDGLVRFDFYADEKSTVRDIMLLAKHTVERFVAQPPIWILIWASFTEEELHRYYLSPNDFVYNEQLGLYVTSEALNNQLLSWQDYFSEFKNPKAYFQKRKQRIERICASIVN